MIEAAGLSAVPVQANGPGTLLLVEAGPGQLHLAVTTPHGFVHADAGLRRVTEVPGRPAGTVLGAWGVAG